MCFDASRIWLLRTIVLFVGGVEHQFGIAQSQQSPIKLIAFARRCRSDDLKSQYVAIETNGRRHVENLYQRADAAHFNTHDPFSYGLPGSSPGRYEASRLALTSSSVSGGGLNSPRPYR